MHAIAAALLIGIAAGLRAMTPLAVTSWAAWLGRLPVKGTWIAFMGYHYTPYVLTLAAVAELVTDKLPTTPSRKMPSPFIARIVSGALTGAVVGAAGHMMLPGLVAGSVGAVVGTLGGYEFRMRLAKATGGRDLPIALLEDIIAIGGSILLLRCLV